MTKDQKISLISNVNQILEDMGINLYVMSVVFDDLKGLPFISLVFFSCFELSSYNLDDLIGWIEHDSHIKVESYVLSSYNGRLSLKLIING